MESHGFNFGTNVCCFFFVIPSIWFCVKITKKNYKKRLFKYTASKVNCKFSAKVSKVFRFCFWARYSEFNLHSLYFKGILYLLRGTNCILLFPSCHQTIKISLCNTNYINIVDWYTRFKDFFRLLPWSLKVFGIIFALGPGFCSIFPLHLMTIEK